MQANKVFLAQLYQSNGMIAKKQLNSASNLQLKLVIHILFAIANGNIPIPLKSFTSLSDGKKSNFVHRHFSSKARVNKILKSSRNDQLNILHKLSNFYPHLFHEYKHDFTCFTLKYLYLLTSLLVFRPCKIMFNL